MVFQLLAMWLIVVVTLVWFVRDERQRGAGKLRLQALHFAAAPHYRGAYREPEAVSPPPLRRPTLSAADRAFLEAFVSKARTGV
jgi:hypothetical protein